MAKTLIKIALVAIIVGLLVFIIAQDYRQSTDEQIMEVHVVKKDNVEMENGEKDIAIEDEQEKGAATCNQQQRLDMIEEYCATRKDMGDLLTDLRSKQHQETFASMYAVPEKKLLLCMPFKSGSTTWQTLLAINFMTKEQIGGRKEFVAGKDFLVWKQVPKEITAAEALERFRDYYKVLVVRHPLDKLESVENALLNSPALFQEVKKTIHKLYHPNLDAPFPYPPGTFNVTDLLRYMRANFSHYARRHYTPNYYDCLPCQLHYDYVAKLETMTTDQRYVVTEKMNGVGLDLALNVQRANKSSLMETGGKELKVFRTVSHELMGFAMDYYQHDMALYGYQFDPMSRVARCRNGDEDGNVCC